MLNSGTKPGFTIVELLIVIVVIAILAAITIVAYNGISSKARDTNNRTDAVAIVKVAETINTDTGSYPQGTTTATLKTAFGATTITKIPNGVDVVYAVTAPTNAAAIINADLTSHTYTVWPCAAGANIYFPSRALGVIQTLKAGAGC